MEEDIWEEKLRENVNKEFEYIIIRRKYFILKKLIVILSEVDFVKYLFDLRVFYILLSGFF